MSKKSKNRAAEVKSRLLSNNEESPFSKVILKEKEEVVVKKKPVVIEKKKPSEIVAGFDSTASFADILYSYEHTGELYSLPSQKRQKAIREKKTDFGSILDKWDNKAPAKKDKPMKKSENKVTKSFSDILSEYDNYKSPIVKKAESPVEKPKAEVVQKPSINKVKKSFEQILAEAEGKKPLPITEEVKTTSPVIAKVEANPFFVKEEEEETRSKEAVWSIFGDNKKVERAPLKDEKVEVEKVVEIKKSAPYVPKKDFGEILSDYVETKKNIKVTLPAVEEMKTEVEVKSETTPGVAWSVNTVKPIDPANFKKAIDSVPIETFEEIMRKKGDLTVEVRKYTISELRTMMPEATLDLHGMSEAEAKTALQDFLAEAKTEKLRKISIIHGKGLHSQDGIGILKAVVELTLNESGLVSEAFPPKAQFGGSGALWVILKEF